jgi:hypothetical protein
VPPVAGEVLNFAAIVGTMDGSVTVILAPVELEITIFE